MASYFETLLLVSGACALLSLLSPKGKSGKGVQFVLSLVLLSCLVFPLSGLLDSDPSFEGDFSYGKEEGDTIWEERLIEEVARGIKASICERFSLKEKEIEVTVSADVIDNTVLVRHLTLSLSGSALTCDLPSIRRYITDNTGAECEVIYK